MGDPVVHFEMMGGDGAAMAGFYGELFGWRAEPVATSGGDYRIVDTGGEGPGGGIGSFPGAPSYVTFYVRVDDLEARVTRATALGGRTVMEPREVLPGLRAALIADPEGHMVGMISDTPRRPG